MRCRQTVNWLILAVWMFVLSLSVAQAQEQVFDEVRQALGARDLETAKAKLASAPAGPEKERLAKLTENVETFWEAVQKGASSLRGTEELMVGDTPVAVVEYNNGRLTIRVAGRNRSYTFQTMKAKLAAAISFKVLPKTAADTKVIVGSFLLVDRYAEPEIAKQLLQEASRAGKDVDGLLKEVALVPEELMQLPPLQPRVRAAMNPRNWLVRQANGDRVLTSNLSSQAATQTSEGRLRLDYDTPQGSEVQVVTRRALPANFSAKVVLLELAPGQRLGLYSTKGENEALYVELPVGGAVVEFSRKGDEITCLINGKKAELQQTEGTSPDLRGHLGLSMSPGDECVIASLVVN